MRGGRTSITREEFKQVFEQALETAACIAEEENSVTLPRTFRIEFHGLGYSGDRLDVESALDKIYLGDNQFFFLIDLAAVRANRNHTDVFLRISSYPPRKRFEDTLNQPPGSGPFKQLIAGQFEYDPEE